jgi:hypothetical protein
MANQKISELTAIATIDNATDVLPIVDTSATTTKKITLTQVKTSLALNNVNNTSDANKPVSTAQQDALNAKVTGNTAIVAATKTKITYDAKGLVTAGNVLDAADMPTAIDAAKIGAGAVSSTEFGYLDGVTSAIQTQLDAKQATLVSATNIKTINSTSLLGAGDISISASPSGVSGAIQFSNGSAFASDAANLFWDNTNKRLGVGTNAPTSPLQVAGTITTQNLFTSGVIYGGSFWLQDNGVLALGQQSAGASKFFVKGSGSTSATTSLLVQNSSGVASLQVNDKGSVYNLGKGSIGSNTVFGLDALQANTTGSQNTAIGLEVLYSNTTGVSNSSYGLQSMFFNTTGGNNSAVGVSALQNNTTGSSNSALGVDTASGNFSGSVILGRGATATASNQFVVGSSGYNAGAVTTATALQTKTWDVIINGVAQKILLA